MKLSQLKKKYPKGFGKFVDYYAKKHGTMKIYEYTFAQIQDFECRELWKEITDFMDKQGIIIFSMYSDLFEKYHYTIYIKKDKTNEKGNLYSFRKQAETKAICKAFEILEERL